MRSPYAYCVHILCILTTLAFSSLYAQSNEYEPGYLVLVNGDTLNGSILFTNDLDISQGIFFRAEKGSQNEKQFSPESLSSLSFTNTDIIYRRINHNYDGEDGTNVEAFRLARQIHYGHYILLLLKTPTLEYQSHIKDIPNYIYYVLKEEEQFKLDIKAKTKTDKVYTLRENYKGVLKFLMSDLPTIDGQINRVNFSEKKLLPLFIKYDAFKGVERAYTTKTKRKYKVNHFIGGNLILLNLDDRKNEFSSGFGLRYLVRLRDKRNEKVGFGTGIELTFEKYETDEQPTLDFLESSNSFEIPFFVEYTPTIANLSPFIRGGVKWDYTRLQGQELAFAIVTTEQGPILQPIGLEDYNQGTISVDYSLSIGLDLMNFRLELELNGDLTSLDNNDINYQRDKAELRTGLSYRF